jgi:ribosome-binding factor A
MNRRRRPPAAGRYPRTARVNELLREVLADTLERLADADERIQLITITAVDCDPDLRHARVLLAHLDEPEREALEELRVRLQAAVSRQVRLKRTPQLSFVADPAQRTGERVEDILRGLGTAAAAEPPPERGSEGPG